MLSVTITLSESQAQKYNLFHAVCGKVFDTSENLNKKKLT